MSEITKTITISIAKYDELNKNIQRLQRQVDDFKRLFVIQKSEVGISATVSAEHLNRWAQDNLWLSPKFTPHNHVDYIVIRKEESK